MKKIYLILILIILVNGCAICQKPYIKVGDDCCLDENDNGICDSNEVIEEEGCPASCDDGDECTTDYCSSLTNYECKHDIIPGCYEEEEEYVPSVVEEGESAAEMDILRLDGEGYLRFGYKFDLIEVLIKNTGEINIEPKLKLTATRIFDHKTEIISKSEKKLDVIEKSQTIHLLDTIPELLMTAAEHTTNEYEFDILIELKDGDEVLSDVTKKFRITRDAVLSKSSIDNPELEIINNDKIWIDDVLYENTKNTADINTVVIETKSISVNNPVIDVFIDGHGENLALYNKIGIDFSTEIPVSFTLKKDEDPTEVTIIVRLREEGNPEVIASNELRISQGMDTRKNKMVLDW